MGSPAEQVRRGRPGHDRDTVLRTAIALFNRQGYDATSMDDVARELGVTKAALYHHVSSKEQLLTEALDEALDELTAVVTEARDPGSDAAAADRLHALVRRSIRVLADHRPAVTLLLRVRGNSEIERRALARRRWIDDQLAALVRDAIAEGSVRPDVPPELVSRLLFGMVNSLVEWWRPDGPVDPEQLGEAVTTLAFDGLSVRPR